MTTGSLILEQMYEDRVMTEGGLLASGRASGRSVLSTNPRVSRILARASSSRSTELRQST